MRSTKDLNDYEFIAANNIKRAMLNLMDGQYNNVEACLSEALECLYKLNKQLSSDRQGPEMSDPYASLTNTLRRKEKNGRVRLLY